MINSSSRAFASAIAAIPLLVAGCGGSSAPAGTASHHSVLAYVRCMHAHGVPNFPDPDPEGGIDKDEIIALGNGPQVNAASNACAPVMPASGLGPSEPVGPPAHVRFTDAMAFARCVRTHGFPTFPDPTRSGELSPQMIESAGIDLHQPAVLRAGDACAGASHGAITKATVARVVAGH